MSWSYIPRWKFTDSCGRPRVLPGGIHVGCAHDGHMQLGHATRRALLKGGVAIVGGAGHGDGCRPPRTIRAGPVFPPPPPAVSPIAGLMDTHVHAAPDVFGRALDDEEVAIIYRDADWRRWFSRTTSPPPPTAPGLRASTSPASRYSAASCLIHRSAGSIRMRSNWMWRMQGGYGRGVWFPTFDADNHVQAFQGCAGRHQGAGRRRKGPSGGARGPAISAPRRSLSSRPGTSRRAEALPSSTPAAMPAATAWWSPMPSSTLST